MRPLKSLTLVSIIILTFTTNFSWSITPEEEIQLGRATAKKFEEKYGVSDDPELNRRLQEVCSRLVQNSPRDLPFTFKVADTDQWNAMALPGGFCYATKGLMETLNDDELAFVMGHEITHAINSHSIKQMEKARSAQVGIIGLTTILTKGQGGQAAELAAKMALSALTSQHSQKDELESDHDGIKYMQLAGYDPAYSLTALEIMAKKGTAMPGFLNSIVGSHPPTSERLSRAIDLVADQNFAQYGFFRFSPKKKSFLENRNKNFTKDIKTMFSHLENNPDLNKKAFQYTFAEEDQKNKDDLFFWRTKVTPPRSYRHAQLRFIQQHPEELAKLFQKNYKEFGTAVVLDSKGILRVSLVLRK